MPKPRLPQDKAKMTGANDKNPKRFKGRSSPKVKSLGSPPGSFDEPLIELWNEFNSDFPWLGRTDRHIVGMACRLQNMIDLGDATINVYAQLRMTLGSMGATPVDRSKVDAPDEKEEIDPLDEFIN